MGLLQKACETYDNHQHLAGEFIVGQEPLVPVAHILQNADIEITIDSNGTFIRVALIDKEMKKTIVPVTIASGGRSGKEAAPHPLCDKLQYLLKSSGKQYEKYIQQLQDWANSSYSVPKLQAVLQYLSQGTIAADLCQSQIIKNNVPDDKEKALFVRWRVEGLGADDTSECWRDKKLFSSWEDYYTASLTSETHLCMLTGKASVITDNHPKNIVAFNANAKLISANDNTNFTFRGRFVDGQEACSLGYLASQKAHNALRWEAAKGKTFGRRTFFCWNPKGKQLPQVWSPLNFNQKQLLEPTDYQNELVNTLTGYKNDLSALDDVVIASMDAATTGRLAITYYNELNAVDFLDRIEHWYCTCCWYNWPFGIQSPPIHQIIKAAYGIDRSDKSDLEVDDALLREHYQRLFKCIVDKMLIPYDIVQALMFKASKPQSYKNSKNYSIVLYAACAVIRKYLNDKKEEWTLTLDKSKKERSYLFGRLLAIMEKAERDTYEKGEERVPNAIRMQAAFCEKPLYYANIINTSLTPYFSRLKPSSEAYYKKIIGEIIEKISTLNTTELNKPLKETYLLGYYLQRNELYTSNKNEKLEAEENDRTEK